MKEFLILVPVISAAIFLLLCYLLIQDSIPNNPLPSNSLEAVEEVQQQMFTQANREIEGEIIVE